MAEIYVTSTADSGAGSLRQAISLGHTGDVILFDPDVFPVGETTVIYLSNGFSINRSIEIDGGDASRIVLDFQNNARGFYIYNDNTITLSNLTIKNGNATTSNGGGLYADSTVVFECNSCAFVDCSGTNGAVFYGTRTSQGTFNNCSFEGCSTTGNGSAAYIIGSAITTFNDCTFSNLTANNGGVLYCTNNVVITFNDCTIDGCTVDSAGGCAYVNGYAQVDFNDCEISNCTSTTSVVYCYSYARVNFTKTSFSDCTCSGSGAVMATNDSQVEVSYCTFVRCTANNGAAIYAVVRGVVSVTNCTIEDCSAETSGGAIRVEGEAQGTVNDCVITNCSSGSSGGAIIVTSSGNAHAVFIMTGCEISECSSGIGGAFRFSGTSINTASDCTITGCTGITQGGGGCISDFAQSTISDCTIENCHTNNTTSNNSGGGLYITGSSVNAITNCRIANCSSWSGGGVGTYNNSQSTFVDCVVTDCSANSGGGIYVRSSSRTELRNCTVTNCTATVYGPAVYSGDTSTLVINTLHADALRMANAAFLIVDGGVSIVADGELNATTVTFTDGAALTITDSAVISSATLTSEGRGYLAVAAGIDTSAATLTNVVLCAYGAGLETFSARETTRTEIKLDWTQTDNEIPVLVEHQVNGVWETVVESTAGTYNVTVEPATRHLFRAFDGVSFHVDAAWHGIEALQFKVVGIIVEADAQDVNWQAITEVVNVDGAVRSGQSITILARIYDAYDNETVLLNETGNIVSVVYTLEKRSKSLFDYTWTPVEGHDEVEVSSECVLEDLQTSDAWTIDQNGYSFVLTPDTTEHTLFATPGVYRFRVKITLAEGNPVVFYEEINVVDE